MSDTLLAVLIAVPVVLFVLRLSLKALPPSGAPTLNWVEVALLALGSLGLVFHCGVMFFARDIGPIANNAPAHAVMQLQTASKFYYALPAVMVAVALHRTRWYAIGGVLGTLVAVYITMYDHGPLDIHLTCITCAVTAISLATFTLTKAPARP